MERNKGRGSLTNRYLAAILAPAVVAGVMQVTWPYFQSAPVSPYFVAVIFCAWYGGLVPGLLSVVVSFFLSDFLFIEPYFIFWPSKEFNLGRTLLFAVVGPFISIMSELMHRERRRAEINLESAKRAEGSLREKERFASQIAELTPVVINVFDLATNRAVFTSPDSVNLLGYTPKEIAEMKDQFAVLWHPEDIPLANENIARCKHGRDGEITEFEYRIRRRDGEWRWVASRIMPFERDEHGVVQQIVIASFDITERKQADEALFRLGTIAEQSDDAIYGKSLEGIVTSWNMGAGRIYGYAEGEIIGCPISMLIPPENRDELPQILGRIGRGERVEHYETVRIRKDGERIHVSLSVSPIKNAIGKIVGASTIARDITEHKLAEEQIIATTEQLRALTASLQSAREDEGTRISREIHDELGGALTCLRWDLESFDKVISESGDQSQVQALRERIEAMLRLTASTINTVRRISSELRPSVLDDLGLMVAIEWQAQEFQARTGIICRCECSLENLDFSRERSTAVFRIFQEALTNILRHAKATRVNIQMNEEKGDFILAISDDGKGITEDEKSGTQSLGLLGMQERAYLTGGNINITGFEGKGTVVTVRIPISD